MACRDDREQPQPSLKERLDLSTRLLCGVTRYLIQNLPRAYHEANDALGGELETWWEAHDRADQERRARARASGIAKLTADEREALGV
jgi:hypothetical protein